MSYNKNKIKAWPFLNERLPEGHHESYCQYRGIAYHNVPGYISGYGCPECGCIGPFHVPVDHPGRGISKTQSENNNNE